MIITDFLERNARLYGGECALVEINPSEERDKAVTWWDFNLIESGADAPYRRELSWKDFDRRANRFANLLLSRGLKKGTKVAILLMNCLEWLPIYFGILKAGCIAVDFGIETGSPSMLEAIKKNIPYDKIKQTFEMCREAEIITLANFIIGFPDETEEQLRDTIEMAKDIPATQRTFFFFMPGPGSELYDMLVSSGRYTPPKTFKEYTNVQFYYSPKPNFSKIPTKELKAVRAYFLWKGFSRKYFSQTARTYDIAKKDIVDVLKQFKGHDLKFALQLVLISAYEFLDIYCYAHFCPSVIKKYNLKNIQ